MIHKYPLFTKWHWAFGRSLDKSEWVLTGVIKWEAAEIKAWLEAYGAVIQRQGCTIKSKHYWFSFSAPKNFVLFLAKTFPVPNGARPLLIGIDGSVRSKADRKADRKTA